jgi:hypothetical protein
LRKEEIAVSRSNATGWLVPAILSVILMACAAPDAADPAPVVIGTEPAPAEQLTALDLPSLAFERDDLPAGYAIARMSVNPAPELRDAPPPLGTLRFEIQFNGLSDGSAAIALYPTRDERDAAYESVVARVSSDASQQDAPPNAPAPPDVAAGIGEHQHVIRQVLYPPSGAILTRTRGVVFARCGTVVLLRLGAGSHDFDQPDAEPPVIRYARRLDERLTPLVCRSQ